jgi:hypothetical protein
VRFRSLVVLVVVLSACGGAGSDTASVPTSASASTTVVSDAPASTVRESGQATTTLAPASEGSTTTRPSPNPDRQLAPDFSLTLNDGTEYQLANETRPVYMVFWAEW